MRRETGKSRGRDSGLRLFLAFDVPTDVKEEIARKRQVLIGDFPKSRWAPPANQHLTVAFLGETAPERVDDIVEALSKSLKGLGRAEFSLHGAGFFPNGNRPRNAWIGGGSAVGAETAMRTGEALRRLGFGLSDTAWTLHLTQARFSKPWPPATMQRFRDWAEELGTIEFSLDTITLFSSVLKPGGARYSSLAKVLIK